MNLDKVLMARGGNSSRCSFAARVPPLFAAAFLSGCNNMPLLAPKGPVGIEELHIIGVAFALMLIVVVPVIFMAIWFPRRFKASDPKGDYAPRWSHSRRIDLIVWLVPAAIVTALATLAWNGSRNLDPYKPVASAVRPIRIEVVSLDWKWLFIYPDLNVATVNRLVLPDNTPVSFQLTSDTVVTSFFIPQLGSQIYAMPGKQSRLHLLADEPGEYFGQNQQFSGNGFADMNFKVTVASAERFSAWAQEARHAEKLDRTRFAELEKPGISAPLTFSSVEDGLFDSIVNKFHTGNQSYCRSNAASQEY